MSKLSKREEMWIIVEDRREALRQITLKIEEDSFVKSGPIFNALVSATETLKGNIEYYAKEYSKACQAERNSKEPSQFDIK